MCANLPNVQSQQGSNPYIEQNLELLNLNKTGIISSGCDGSFSPSAATNQQNSIRDVVQLSQSHIIAISEAIQQANHNN